MKKLLYVLSVIVLVSCGQHKKDNAKMQVTQDSLAQLAVQKNNAILEFIDEMNEIQSNLDSIKALEKNITVKKASGTELKTEAKQRITEDMALINDLQQKNKALVKMLTNRYRDSNAKITELETTLANMNKQMAEKDADIDSLTSELETMNINVTYLNEQLKTITTESEKTIRENEEALEEHANVINTAYWAFGTKKELEDKNVIEKDDGVLVPGKTLALKKEFNRDYFKKVDIREFKKLTLNAKKAVLLANRPADSYHIIETDRIEGLVIDNPDEFWKDSKYLVVVLEK